MRPASKQPPAPKGARGELEERLGANRCAELDDEIGRHAALDQREVYGAILHGLRLRQACETLSPTWSRDRDVIVAAVRRELKRLVRHVRTNEIGEHLVFDIVGSVVVEELLLAGLGEVNSASLPFDEHMKRANARNRSVRASLRAALSRALDQPRDFRGAAVDWLTRSGPLKPGRPALKAVAGRRGGRSPKSHRGGSRAGSGRRNSVWRHQAFRLLRRAGATHETAAWLLSQAGLTADHVRGASK